MQFLTKRLLGLDMTLTPLHNIDWMFKSYKSEIINTLRRLQDLSNNLRDVEKFMVPDGIKLDSPIQNITSDSWKSIGFFVSSQNIRVKNIIVKSSKNYSTNNESKDSSVNAGSTADGQLIARRLKLKQESYGITKTIKKP